MLKSYEAIYENGRIKWTQDQPPIGTARVIVTVLEEAAPLRRRVPLVPRFVPLFRKADVASSLQ